jgi:hypothetical protein
MSKKDRNSRSKGRYNLDRKSKKGKGIKRLK